MGPGASFKTLEQGQEGAAAGKSLCEGRRLAAAAGTARGQGMSSRKLKEVGGGTQLLSQCRHWGSLRMWEHVSGGWWCGERRQVFSCVYVATSASCTCGKPKHKESANDKAAVRSSNVLSAK